VTSSHIFFIPGMIMVGLFFGFILGARAARNQVDLNQRRQAERDAVKAARAEKKKQQGEAAGPSSSAS
jgi:hypothetical protein